MKWKKFILVGDSNTQYGYSKEGKWVSMLSDLLQRQCDVINRGFSGYNSTHMRKMIVEIFEEFDVNDIAGVVVLLGSNDATHPDNTIQHVDVNDFKENVRFILDHLINKLKISKEIVTIVTQPRKFDSKWEKTLSPGEKLTQLDALVPPYAQASRDLAKEFDINLFDLCAEMTKYESSGQNLADLLYDGLHFSEIASQMLYDGLVPILKEKVIKNLKFNYPYWRDLANYPSNIPQFP